MQHSHNTDMWDRRRHKLYDRCIAYDVNLGVWFSKSRDVRQYLDLHNSLGISYSIINQAAVNKKTNAEDHAKNGCMAKYFVQCKSGHTTVTQKESL